MADFWVRKNGGSNKAAAVDLTNAMSVAAFNAASFDAGDRVCFSGIDGDLVTGIVPSVGGITLLADPERGCMVHGNDTVVSCIDIASKDDIEVDGINVTHPSTDGVQVRGTSSGVIIRNVEASYSANQAFQMEETASAIFYNITGRNCLDDGFSMHDAAVAKIYGGIFTDNVQGINTIHETNLEANDCVVSGCSGESIYVADVSLTGKIPVAVFNNVRVTGGTYGLWARYNANVKLINCVFDAAAMANHCVQFESTATGFVFGSVFFGMAALKFGVAARAGCTFNGLYNSIFLPGVGRGFFSEVDAEAVNSIFSGLNIGIFRGAGTTINRKNCCFFGNTKATDGSGTLLTSGNVTADPLLSGYLLGAKSPCIGAGLSAAGVTDIYADRYGTTRHYSPSIGQDQTTGKGFGPWTPFASMPTLSLAATAPGSLLEVQEWTKVATAREIGKL